jgi:hypothetical protein
LPSDVIGMQGVVRLIQMLNCFAFGAWALVCLSPQAKASMSRPSRVLLISPVLHQGAIKSPTAAVRPFIRSDHVHSGPTESVMLGRVNA